MGRVLPENGLLLASASPRRRSLLSEAGLVVRLHAVSLAERRQPGEAPSDLAARLARAKARAAGNASDEGLVVVAADTIVVDGDRILGKPRNPQEAREMLLELAGREHRVISGLAVIDRASGEEVVTLTQTELALRRMEPREVAAYVEGGSPLDKAGAYGIQDAVFQPVDMARLRGCFTNVMGLPLCTLERALASLGWNAGVDLTDACFSYHRHPLSGTVGVS